MRPALQRLLGSPSALTILRHAIESPDHVFACRPCRATSSRKQSSGPEVVNTKKESAAAESVSARILNYITGEFRRKRQAKRLKIRKHLCGMKKQEFMIRAGVQAGVSRSREFAASVGTQSKHDDGVVGPTFIENRPLIRTHVHVSKKPREAQTRRSRVKTSTGNFKILKIPVSSTTAFPDATSKEPKQQTGIVSRDISRHHTTVKLPHNEAIPFRKTTFKRKQASNERRNILHKDSEACPEAFSERESNIEGQGPNIRIRKYGMLQLRKHETLGGVEMRHLRLSNLHNPQTSQETHGTPNTDTLPFNSEKDGTYMNYLIVNDQTEAEVLISHSGASDIGKSWEPSSHLQMIDKETEVIIGSRSGLSESAVETQDDAKALLPPQSFSDIERFNEPFDYSQKALSERSAFREFENASKSAIRPLRVVIPIDWLIMKAVTSYGQTQDDNCGEHQSIAARVRKQAFEINPRLGASECSTDPRKLTSEGISRVSQRHQDASNATLPLNEPTNQIVNPVWSSPTTGPETWKIYDLNEKKSERRSVARHAQAEPEKLWGSVPFDFESRRSDKGSDPIGDSGPVGLKEISSDFESWLLSALSRRRGSERNYVRQQWRKLLFHNQELPTGGALADDLWEYLLNYGFSNQSRLEKVISYAKRLREITGKAWKDFYYRVALYHLKQGEDRGLHWHDALHPTHQPRRDQFISLIERAHGSAPRSVAKLQDIYQQLPFRDLYAPILQHLYREEKFMAAASWHDVFIACKDLPEDTELYRPLFRYMVLYGSKKRLDAMVRHMIDLDIPLPTFINHAMPSNPVAREVVDQRLAVTHGITAKAMGDTFYARLFATAWFSTDTVINILRMVGAQSIGPASLRELAIKERSNPQAVQSRLHQLGDVGISLTSCTFCKLVERLCKEENSILLEEVIQCDLHADTFDDQNLQESLLGNYHATGQRLQFDRTLAILLESCPDRYHNIYYWNLHLRLYLKAKDLQAVTQTLQMMQASHLPLAIKTVHYIRICLLARRRVGMRPRTTKELFFIINIWQAVLRSGGTMPANIWVDVLRRLGMTGQLEEYEKLALWLAEWYSSSPARAYLGGLLEPPPPGNDQAVSRAIDIPRRVQPWHRNHPLHVLFPRAGQQAIVAWGFQHSRIGGPGWRWGLYLLLKLKQRKVHVDRATVAKACRLRLTALFGRGISNRLINRRERARNAAQLDYYVREMEKIGGKGFLRSVEWEWKRINLDAREIEDN